MRISGEETKVYIAVLAVKMERRMGGKIIMGRMLQDEPACRFEQSFFENDIRKFFQAFHIVGWVCKDDIEPVVQVSDHFKHIIMVDLNALKFQLMNHFGDESDVDPVPFDDLNILATPRCKLQADAAGTGEQIQNG